MSDEALQVCVWRVGAQDFAVDLRRVDEILPVPPVTPLPGGPAFLLGLATLEAKALPVVDVGARLGAPRPAEGPTARRARLVVCRLGTRRVGFLVEAVPRVLTLRVDQLRAPPPGSGPHVLGACGEGAGLTLLLDVKALLEERSP